MKLVPVQLGLCILCDLTVLCVIRCTSSRIVCMYIIDFVTDVQYLPCSFVRIVINYN